MLDFFRRYQKYFFLVITVMIIISFSFFGTSNTLGSNKWSEQIAFKAIDGKDVTRWDVDEMARFLATDNEDKQSYGGAWGPNFLNDGVIRKNLLETGMAQQLVQAYQYELRPAFNQRTEKERKYSLYTHPQAKFLSVQNVWNYFAPDMIAHFDILKNTAEGTNPEAFNSRVKLYLAEKQFTPSMLKQMLRYQEKQYNWLAADENLDRMDLSLYGYHTLEDWFSPAFTRLVSEFIINTALLAEAQGYQVSKAEALSDLIRHAQMSYQENKNKPSIGVASPEEYFDEQLRILNMDQSKAVKIWRQVLLFRRYFQDAGYSALVDTLPYKKYNEFSHETVTADLYRLPAPLRLANYEALQKFQAYLDAVSASRDTLGLPKVFLSSSEVARVNPDLVQKRYLIEFSQASQKNLQARIGIKELWSWEVEDQNWELLKKQFPELGVKQANNREKRYEVLDSLDALTRTKLDTYAKAKIVKSHPEWISQSLAAAESEKILLGLREEGGSFPIGGMDTKEKRTAFIKSLDNAKIGDPAHVLYSSDDKAYYRIEVLDKGGKPDILTFAEALADGTMDRVKNRMLEKYYIALRVQNPSDYQNDKQEWKPFKDVQESVADNYFKNILDALKPIQKELATEQHSSENKDQAATLRFYPHINTIKNELVKNPESESQFIRKNGEKGSENLSQRPPLSDQWLLEKTTVAVKRQEKEEGMDSAVAFSLPVGTWSALHAPANGDLAFFQVLERGVDTAGQEIAIAEQTKRAQALLSIEAQKTLMEHVLEKIEEKKAISLAFLQTPQEDPAPKEDVFLSDF
ncbi:MAG: SurA N-terminal domain-containing protein [Candidatus Protochlamydia sp.]|nr:SurA N-terminal domain-containing protein [Candidatus Protochlamydia sp.]